MKKMTIEKYNELKCTSWYLLGICAGIAVSIMILCNN